MGGLMLVAVRGLAIAKWIHNAGGFVLLIVLAGMTLFALPRWFGGGAAVAPVALSFPAVSLLNLNLLGKMGFGAFWDRWVRHLFGGMPRSGCGPHHSPLGLVGRADHYAFLYPRHGLCPGVYLAKRQGNGVGANCAPK